MSQPIQHESNAAAVVQAALGKDSASIADMLERIAGLLDAFGCVLWGLVPGTDLTANPPKGKLYVMAGWFPTPGEIFAMHDLPLDFPSGQVVLTRQPVRGVVGKDGFRFYDHAFLRRHQVRAFCGVLVQFRENEYGVLSVYRVAGRPEFEQEEQERLERLGAIVPFLCQAIRHRLSLQLLQKVETILQDAERQSEKGPLDKSAKRLVLDRICKEVADAFNASEVSVFLEDRLERSRVYELQATTRSDWVPKKEYRADKAEGLTGWPLVERTPIHLFDLFGFDVTANEVQTRYPGLTWKNSLKVESLPPEEFGAKTREEQPPLTFMAAPCLMGAELLGAIRCCTAKRGPYYFSEYEVRLLQLVAAQISQCWFTWMNRRVVQQENESWGKLVEGMGQLNDFVQRELQKDQPDQAQIFEQTLALAQQTLPGADINDIRLFDETTRELYHATIPKNPWPSPMREKILDALRHRRTNVDEHPPKSAGAEAFQTGQVVIRSDSQGVASYHTIFPGVKRVAASLIKVGTVVLGVLEVRGTGAADFPSNTKTIMALLGSQLGLFLHLARTVASLRKAEVESKESLDDVRELQEAQVQSYQDLAHQLKTPLNQALSRASAAVYALTGETRQELVRIRSLCSKVNRVTQSLRLLGELANGQPLNLRRSKVDYAQLMKTLVEAAQDNELTVESKRKVRFNVERNTFVGPWISRVSVDPLLFDQALNNLLDNAAKYSFENTEVGIYGGMAGGKSFHITVVNRGLPIRAADVPSLTQRGFRGRDATFVTQEGSGIGLWIVDHIMKAHGGELNINPTRADGKTEVKLIFPLID